MVQIPGPGCLGKTRWKTERTARWTLQAMRQAWPGRFDSLVRPYRCFDCRRWHLGHAW